MVGSTDRTSRQTSMPEPSGQPGVEDGDVGAQRGDPACGLLGQPRLADHLDVVRGLQQLAQPASDDLVVVQQEHLDGHWPHLACHLAHARPFDGSGRRHSLHDRPPAPRSGVARGGSAGRRRSAAPAGTIAGGTTITSHGIASRTPRQTEPAMSPAEPPLTAGADDQQVVGQGARHQRLDRGLLGDHQPAGHPGAARSPRAAARADRQASRSTSSSTAAGCARRAPPRARRAAPLPRRRPRRGSGPPGPGRPGRRRRRVTVQRAP